MNNITDLIESINYIKNDRLRFEPRYCIPFGDMVLQATFAYRHHKVVTLAVGIEAKIIYRYYVPVFGSMQRLSNFHFSVRGGARVHEQTLDRDLASSAAPSKYLAKASLRTQASGLVKLPLVLLKLDRSHELPPVNRIGTS